jgi:hypothetical protein
MKYQECRLSDAGLAYVKERVSLGHSLAQIVSKSMNWDNILLMTYLQDGTDVSALTDFRSGGLARRDLTTRWLSSKLTEVLKSHPGLIMVFEDQAATPNDEWTAKAGVPVVAYGSEVYYVADESVMRDAAKLEQVVNMADAGWLMLGFLTTVASLQYDSGFRLTRDSIVNLAEKTVCVIAGAFDGEGYVLAGAMPGEQKVPDTFICPQ